MIELMDKVFDFGKIAEQNSLDDEGYAELVRKLNEVIIIGVRSEIGATISEEFGDHIGIFTTGSDGRLEKGSEASQLEIIIISPDLLEVQEKEALEEKIGEISETVKTTKVFRCVETKTPDTFMANYKVRPGGNPGKNVQPARILDSRHIAGDKGLQTAAKRQLGQEIITRPSKVIVGKVASLRQDARKTTLTGKNRIGGKDVEHFNTDSGVFNYDPANHNLSFKIGPLRWVQNGLLAQEIKFVRSQGKDAFLLDLPANIIERLAYLSSNGNINLEEDNVKTLQLLYAYFLRLYHRSEQNFHLTGNTQGQLQGEDLVELRYRLKELGLIMDALEIK